jgi:hypothetical protein
MRGKSAITICSVCNVKQPLQFRDKKEKEREKKRKRKIPESLLSILQEERTDRKRGEVGQSSQHICFPLACTGCLSLFCQL